MTRAEILARLAALKPWLASQGVTRPRLFGSHARDEARVDSDVDLIADFDRPPGFSFFTLQDEVGARLGLKVDLVTEAGLAPDIRYARTLFEAALVRFLFLRDVKESRIGGQAKSNSHGRVRYAEAFGHSRRAVHAFGFEFGDQMGMHQQICGKAVRFGFLPRTNPVVRRSRPHGAVSQGIADTKLEQVAMI